MKQLLRNIFEHVPYIGHLREQVMKQGAFQAGHYYSPIPNDHEIVDYLESHKRNELELPDVDLRTESQVELLKEYQEFYDDIPFPQRKEPGYRYYYDQKWFCYGDAIFLYCFLRKNMPRRIVEVGSGFSSAVMLDTVEKFFPGQTKITFIEPHPDRLMSILKSGDLDSHRIVKKRLQETPMNIFTSLAPGDLLFVDSSHVIKCGSDIHLLMFDIMPKLPSGVFIHFHDVFYPFEYPREWLLRGKYWNEAYFLRAFLAYNCGWSIYFFNSYVAVAFRGFLKGKMPLCLKDPGGSIYIHRMGRS